MKIRRGFVSNSSSTSFLIYGVSVDELKLNFKELGEIKKIGIEYFYGPYGDSLYIGKSWDKVGDNQTGAEFKEEIENAIKENITAKYSNFGTFEEAWYDG